MSIDMPRDHERRGTQKHFVSLAAFGAGALAAVIVLVLISSAQNRPTFEARFWGEEPTVLTR